MISLIIRYYLLHNMTKKFIEIRFASGLGVCDHYFLNYERDSVLFGSIIISGRIPLFVCT